jgi:hypothetical protein
MPEAPKTWPLHAPSSAHVMAKPTGAVCNLDCHYCFFLSKDTLYPGSNFRMGEDLLEAYIRQVLEAQRSPQVTIAWQGGEPKVRHLQNRRFFVEREISEAVDDILVWTRDEGHFRFDVIVQHAQLAARRRGKHAVESS